MESFPIVPKATKAVEIRTIMQLETIGSWFENIAVRPDGDLLITRLDAPEIWSVNQKTGRSVTIVTFPSSFRSVMGITEVTPDLWAVGVGYYHHQEGGASAGSWEIWLVDLTRPDDEPQTRSLAKIPEAGMVNGLTTWNSDTVLVVDSVLGVIFKINIHTGEYAIALADKATMAPVPGAPVSIGVNGVRVRDGFIYYTNTTILGLFRIKVNSDLVPTGPVEQVVIGIVPDDFCFDEEEEGVIYVTGNASNVVSKIVITQGAELVSTMETYAGDFESLAVAGATACAFGRSDLDKRTLYVVTCGGIALPVQGKFVEGAKLVAIPIV